MRWPNLVGKVRQQPETGRWHEWKEQIATHCDGICVYCAISEARFGGIRNFHIEHFRPKAKFQALEDDITNLYLACAICNVLKSDDWPNDPAPDHSLPAYPDPSATDYNTLFEVSTDTYEVAAATLAGRYLVERILLNRAQLIVERRLAAILKSLAEFEDWVQHSLDRMEPAEWRSAVKVLGKISHVKTSIILARPYKDADTKRPRNAQPKKQSRTALR